MKPILVTLSAIHTLSFAGTLEFKELVKDQSVAIETTTVTTDFEFTNKTDKAVSIIKAELSCPCLAVQVSGGKMRYSPGESGVIRTIFEVGNATGSVEKAVPIFLDNDPPDKPSLNLRINFHIPVLVAVEPKTVSWDIGGNTGEKVIHIKMAEGTPINVTGVTLKDSFKYDLKTIEKGVSYDLVVSPKSTDQPDLGIIRIGTDSKIAKQKVQQAFVVVRRPIPTKEVSQK